MIPHSFRRLNARVARALVRRWAVRVDAPAPGWPALQAELDLWRGQPARFWWRDDDAIDATPELHRLLAVRDTCAMPLAMAVIPSKVTPALAPLLRDQKHITVFAHGWNHRDHGGSGKPSGELTAGRRGAEVAGELRKGRAVLENLFGDQFKAVLVPPHNHLAVELVPSVLQAGFGFVSIDGDFAGFPMPSRNVHIDVIDWQRNQTATPSQVVRSAIAALRLRRFGLIRKGAPIGLVTHHLVHDAAAWDVTASLLDCLRQHPAATFPAMSEIFS